MPWRDGTGPPWLQGKFRECGYRMTVPRQAILDVLSNTTEHLSAEEIYLSVKGSDFCILVTEPTPFGLHDLVLAVEVLEKMKIPFGVVINRSDIGDEGVDNFCRSKNIPILMRIPFDKDIAFLYSNGIPFVTEKKEYLQKFADMFGAIQALIGWRGGRMQ